MNKMASFLLFLVLWNKIQGQATPSVHLRISHWLERAWINGDKHLLLMAFRSCGKSTIIGVFASWLLYKNPNLRIMVLAADNNLARKMVRNVKRIIERHPLTTHLKPDKIDQWGSDRFTVQRALELRDPSMLARGITTNLTGSRADFIICDDVEVPNTCDTAEKRKILRESLAEIDFVLTPGGSQLYVGTPHSWFTIYADKPRTEINEAAAFLSGFKRLIVPIIDEDNKSSWPERYSLDDIENLRIRSGPNRFASQMLLQPVNIAEGRFQCSDLVPYDEELIFNKVQNAIFIGDNQMQSCCAYWDPSFGRSGDGSVLAILFTDQSGHYWLHDLIYVRVNPNDPSDEASQQCKMIAQKLLHYHVPCITVESNGIGKFLPSILRRELSSMRVPCAVREHNNLRQKELRILDAFDPVLAARALHIHRRIYQTPFLSEMQEWNPQQRGGRDDGLDAVAGALSLAPVLIQTGHYAARQIWQQGQYRNQFTIKGQGNDEY
jgi:hypothetical protein